MLGERAQPTARAEGATLDAGRSGRTIPSMPVESFYFLDSQNVRRGPVPVSQIRSCPLTADTLVWHDHLDEWIRLGDVPELWRAFSTPVGSAPAAPARPPQLSPVPAHPPASPPRPAGDPHSPMALIALILSLAGIGWWCLPGSFFVAWAISLAAIVVAIMAMVGRRGSRGIAIGGLVLGIGNLLAAVALLLFLGMFVAVDAQRRGEWGRGPRPNPPPAVPATMPTMPRIDIKQPTFPTGQPARETRTPERPPLPQRTPVAPPPSRIDMQHPDFATTAPGN